MKRSWGMQVSGMRFSPLKRFFVCYGIGRGGRGTLRDALVGFCCCRRELTNLRGLPWSVAVP